MDSDVGHLHSFHAKCFLGNTLRTYWSPKVLSCSQFFSEIALLRSPRKVTVNSTTNCIFNTMDPEGINSIRFVHGTARCGHIYCRFSPTHRTPGGEALREITKHPETQENRVGDTATEPELWASSYLLPLLDSQII